MLQTPDRRPSLKSRVKLGLALLLYGINSIACSPQISSVCSPTEDIVTTFINSQTQQLTIEPTNCAKNALLDVTEFQQLLGKRILSDETVISNPNFFKENILASESGDPVTIEGSQNAFIEVNDLPSQIELTSLAGDPVKYVSVNLTILDPITLQQQTITSVVDVATFSHYIEESIVDNPIQNTPVTNLPNSSFSSTSEVQTGIETNQPDGILFFWGSALAVAVLSTGLISSMKKSKNKPLRGGLQPLMGYLEEDMLKAQKFEAKRRNSNNGGLSPEYVDIDFSNYITPSRDDKRYTVPLLPDKLPEYAVKDTIRYLDKLQSTIQRLEHLPPLRFEEAKSSLTRSGDHLERVERANQRLEERISYARDFLQRAREGNVIVASSEMESAVESGINPASLSLDKYEESLRELIRERQELYKDDKKEYSDTLMAYSYVKQLQYAAEDKAAKNQDKNPTSALPGKAGKVITLHKNKDGSSFS